MPTASRTAASASARTIPTFDEKEGKVVTLELALNRCREANGEAPYSYVKDEMASLTAYMAFTSRGKPMDIKIPNDPRALEAYENGKRYFYTRRGQLNFSCATCHVQSPGERIRAEILAPALGILNAMPIYRSEWSGMGTTSRRFITCNSQTRAVPLEPQSDEYRDRRIFPVLCRQRPADLGPGSAAMSEKSCDEAQYWFLRCGVADGRRDAGAWRLPKPTTRRPLPRPKPPRSRRTRSQQMDHDGSAARGSEEGGGRRRFRRGIAAAKEAEALAKASIFQATSEKERWKDMEIR